MACKILSPQRLPKSFRTQSIENKGVGVLLACRNGLTWKQAKSSERITSHAQSGRQLCLWSTRTDRPRRCQTRL